MTPNKSSRRVGEQGSVLVEAAITMLAVVFLILGGIQVGQALWAWHTMLLAVGEAGRYAMLYNPTAYPGGPPAATCTVAMPALDTCAAAYANSVWGSTFGSVSCTGGCAGAGATMTFAASYNVDLIVTSITLQRQMTVQLI